MDENRKRAYMFLIYKVFIDLRMFTGGRLPWWNPLLWKRYSRALWYVHSLAYAFHNVALYASRGMVGFDEDKFWEGIDEYNREIPEMAGWTNYRKIFEERLAAEHQI